jgi:hypothetical protein
MLVDLVDALIEVHIVLELLRGVLDLPDLVIVVDEESQLLEVHWE